LEKTNGRSRGGIRLRILSGCRGSKKRVVGAAVGDYPAKFFETLAVIGFALRYHSNRRTAGRLSGIPDGRSRGPGFGAVPSASTIDGTVRARIIGAFALSVST
jgi:hypothetical protein